MKKILFVIMAILILVVTGNILTKKHFSKVYDNMCGYIDEIKGELIKEESEIDFDKTKEKVNEIEEYWLKEYEILAFYVEHAELDKVNIQMAGLKGYVDAQDQNESVASLDNCKFILEHIRDRGTFRLRNIF